MSYRFHASAPPGEWINDPNALFFADGRYRLFAQHAADAPAFKRIGWGHFSSPDLQDWRWEGLVMPPEERVSIYSGSAVVADPLRLFFTRHDPDGPRQTQHAARLAPGCARAGPPSDAFGPAGRNARDPFVYRAGDGWRMLVARPCDWTTWRDEGPSTLELWALPGSERWEGWERWERRATIGPSSPPGVMWEVPALLDLGDAHALILSLVDRRADVADCEVRYWLGRMGDDGFAPAPGFPAHGVLLDHGPDFYAAIPNVAEGWPSRDRVVVGWASSWRTARAMPWPEARGGGPIAMPRRVELVGDRLVLAPGLDRAPDHVAALETGGRLRVERGGAALELEAMGSELVVRRIAPGLDAFERRAPSPPGEGTEARLFVDDLLVELFWRGATVTAALPGEGALRVV